MKQASNRLPVETQSQRRSRQFHVLHLYRVRARDVGLDGNEDGEVSCSTCHKSFEPIDRETPVTTCGRCHNGNSGQVASVENRTILAGDEPNCTSCHVQHVRQPRHWNSRLLVSRKDSTLD
jgi:hypothetical protein